MRKNNFIDHAIIIAAASGLDGECLSALASVRIGGVLQLKRLIITAERAGLKKLTIIIDGNDNKLKEIIDHNNNSNIVINWHDVNSPLTLENLPYLVIQSNLIITPRELSNFMNSDISEEEVGFLLYQKPCDFNSNLNELIRNEFFPVSETVAGAYISYGKILEKALDYPIDLASWAKKLALDECIKPIWLKDNNPMRFFSDEVSRQKAENLLFDNIRKSERGWMSRNVNRRISIPISRLLIKTPLTPNIISVIVGIIGILSGVFYALGHVILGGLFIEISSILDGCDGEVAKIKLMESKTGQWIDTVLDQLSYAAFIVGVPIGYLISAGKTTSIVLGVVNLSMYIFCVTWGVYFLSKYADSGTMVSYPSTIDKLVPLDQRYFVYKIVYLVRPLLQREYLAFIVFLASIIGGYILVLCITTLTFVLTTIHIYDDIMMLNRVKESHGNLARKAHIV